MHEMSLLRGLFKQIDAISREHGAQRVTVVRLKLGPLAHIEPDHLREHFVEAALGTVAQSARLEIETTDELHEITLESVDLDESVPCATGTDDLLALPALEAWAERTQREGGHACRPCLATGGHLKVALAGWTGRRAFLTHPIGNLDEAHHRAAFDATVRELGRREQFEPATIACDLHPDYYTTRWADDQVPPKVRVQHHHAHAVACMVEHDLLEREVVAVTWDGTGFGTDGTIWGGEILRASVRGFERIASLAPFPLPGGESAIRRPNRVAFAMLVQALGAADVLRDDRLLQRLCVSPREAEVLVTMIDRNIQTPRTSSMGRLFDAVAALVLGIDHADSEGEPARQLESAADPAVHEAYELPMCDGDLHDGTRRAHWAPMLHAIVADVFAGVEPGVIASRFHNALAVWAARVAAEEPQREVVLSGGCFLNRLLSDRVEEAMCERGRRVFRHDAIPTGDAGLAAGQLAVAMSCLRKGAEGAEEHDRANH